MVTPLRQTRKKSIMKLYKLSWPAVRLAQKGMFEVGHE